MSNKRHDDDREAQQRIEEAFRSIVFDRANIIDKPMCECHCDNEPYRHADRPCGRRAGVHVALHRWGDCDKPVDWDGPAEQVDADGNICAVMCTRCAAFALSVAAANVKKLIGVTPRGIVPHCPSCGRPTVEAADICQVTAL